MDKIEKRQTNIENLLQLINENPTLSIVPMVDTDVVASDDFAWWTAEWGNASVEEIYNDDERVYIRSKDEERLIENITSYCLDESVDEDYAFKQAEEQVKNYEWEKVIAIKITV